MGSVAVPKKMIPVPNIYGVEAFKEVKPEIVALHPVQHVATEYTTAGTDRISFRVPAYSNALMDTSRSFIHMNLNADADEVHIAAGLPIFKRIVVKTSSGLTLEDTDELDVLQTLMEVVKPETTMSQSIYGNSINGVQDAITATDGSADISAGNGGSGMLFTPSAVPNKTKDVIYRFNTGIFSKHLTKFLPLFMADGGSGYSFDVDIYLSDAGLDKLTPVTDPVTPKIYHKLKITKPVWYMHLMRMDEGLARRFNQMAVRGEEIRIPFITWHTHRTSLVADSIISYIHENATNFKKILTCIYNPRERLITASAGHRVAPTGIEGGRWSESNRVSSYNYRIGVQHVYNEPVQESVSNARTLQFVKSSFGISDNTVIQGEALKTPRATNAESARRVFDRSRFMSVASFDYSPTETGVIQGISSSNPVELSLKVEAHNNGADGSGARVVLNFCELAYDLVFKNGAIHYEEQKPGSQSVY